MKWFGRTCACTCKSRKTFFGRFRATFSDLFHACIDVHMYVDENHFHVYNSGGVIKLHDVCRGEASNT